VEVQRAKLRSNFREQFPEVCRARDKVTKGAATENVQQKISFVLFVFG
jgi:hypothetical protein